MTDDMRESAALLLRCSADIQQSRDWSWFGSMCISDAAADLNVGYPAKMVAVRVYEETLGLIRDDNSGSLKGVCHQALLEAAALLEEGWTP